MSNALALLLAMLPSQVAPGLNPVGSVLGERDLRLVSNPALLGSDPHDRSFHMRLTLLDLGLPLQTWSALQPHSTLIFDGTAEEILTDREFLQDLWKLDDQPVSVRNGLALAAWQGNWAASTSIIFHPGIRIDRGIAVPSIEAWDSTDVHVRFGIAQPFGPWRIGTGFHLRGQAGSVQKATLRDPTRLGDEIDALRDSALMHFRGLGLWSAGLDLGVLRQLGEDFQAGARVAGLGLKDQQGEFETPRVDLGAAWIPSAWHQGPRWASRIALGMQLRDVLETGTPFLGHLDFGATARQNLTPRGIEVRSQAGLRGGWPTAGLGLTLGFVMLDGSVWVEDLDPVLGRTPMEHWDLRLQMGW